MPTPILQLEYLVGGQSGGEVVFNENMKKLELASVLQLDGITNTPPDPPWEGATYLTGDAPTGAWAGNPNMLAVYSDGVWYFSYPYDGQLLCHFTADPIPKFGYYDSGLQGLCGGAIAILDDNSGGIVGLDIGAYEDLDNLTDNSGGTPSTTISALGSTWNGTEAGKANDNAASFAFRIQELNSACNILRDNITTLNDQVNKLTQKLIDGGILSAT